jgi:subtilisin family serine protease
MLVSAQPGGKSTIVVFADNVKFDDFLPFLKSDGRGNADPPAWGYLSKNVLAAVNFLEGLSGFQADQVYSKAIKGFAAKLNANQIAALKASPLIKLVEDDGVVNAIGKPSAPAPTQQTVPWGIAKIGPAGYWNTGLTNSSARPNVYVIDTGIDASHPDLNVVSQVNFAGGQNTDCNGHGTHVAGTIAAVNNTRDVVGVAPGLNLYAVKVLSCSGSGTTSGVIKGIDWVTTHHTPGTPAVANMSLGGGASTALDDAVRRSAADGVVYALAAGNEGADACGSSPARAGAGTNNGIITAGALDSSDGKPSWSNSGTCVDVWAPGVSILSTARGGGLATMSGTSMASPHVAGTAARYLYFNPGSSVSVVENAIKSISGVRLTVAQ